MSTAEHKHRTEHVSPQMRFLQPRTGKFAFLYNTVAFVACVTNSGHEQGTGVCETVY